MVFRGILALDNGTNPREAIRKLGNALTKKLIHPTTAAIRGAAAEDRLDQLDFIQHTYDLQVPTAADGQAAPEEPRENEDEAS